MDGPPVLLTPTDPDAHPHPYTHPDSDTSAPARAHPDATAARTPAHADTRADTSTPTSAGRPSGTAHPARADAHPAAAPPPRAAPAAGPETVGHPEAAPVRDAGALPALPRGPGPAPFRRRHETAHLRPAHHDARGGSDRRAAAALKPVPTRPLWRHLLPEWLVLTLAMLAACVVVVVITLVRHRRVADDEDPSETPDVIEYMTMWIGVVYAIVLGLAIAGVWEGRSAAQETVQAEAVALHEVSERVRVYPVEVRDRIREDVNAYVGHVVTTEWRAMADDGQITERGTELLDRVRRDVTDYEPRTDFEAQAYQPLVDQVAAADQARSARAESTGETMPGVVWFGLLSGAVITIGMIFALQIRRTAREMVLAGLFSALIAFLLFLIWDFDAPYSRGLAASADPFLRLFPHIGG